MVCIMEVSPLSLDIYVSLGVSCRYGILMRSSIIYSFAYLILIFNYYYMIDLVVSIGITFGSLSQFSWFWQTWLGQ